jgi:thiamine biosynthesis lipoprotein
MRRKLNSWFLISVLNIFFFTTCNKSLNEFCYDGLIFGSYLRILLPAKDSSTAEQFIKETMRLFYHIDSVASVYNPQSEISLINKEKSGKMSEDLKALILKSLEISENTDGAFDITVGGILEEWGFYQSKSSPKAPPRLESYRMNYKDIIIRDDSIILPSQMKLDLGGIAVGFALDKASELLKKRGVPYGLIDAGGDIIVWGEKTYRVGIKNPHNDNVAKILTIKNCAVSTSGNYERYQQLNDRRFSHIIAPKIKAPISETTDLTSVTIIAKNGVEADAYATAIYVLGRTKGPEFVKKLNLEAIFITRDGQIIEVKP